MKKILEKIKSILKNFKKNKNSYAKPSIMPHRDWVYIIIFSNLVILILIVYSIYLYFRITSDTFVVYDPSKTEAELKLNTDLLNKIVQDLNNRQRNVNSMSNSKVPLDPSR